jgi:hypothetical protein
MLGRLVTAIVLGLIGLSPNYSKAGSQFFPEDPALNQVLILALDGSSETLTAAKRWMIFGTATTGSEMEEEVVRLSNNQGTTEAVQFVQQHQSADPTTTVGLAARLIRAHVSFTGEQLPFGVYLNELPLSIDRKLTVSTFLISLADLLNDQDRDYARGLLFGKNPKISEIQQR